MAFIGQLKYEKIKDKKSFVGQPTYKLTQEFAYITDIVPGLNPEYKIVCEKGFETDFASVPSWIFFLRPRNGKWAKASVIHDRACHLASNKVLSYKTADRIFYYAMLEDEASQFTANFMYFWVRLNHLVVGKG